jgi:hypothetical protein
VFLLQLTLGLVPMLGIRASYASRGCHAPLVGHRTQTVRNAHPRCCLCQAGCTIAPVSRSSSESSSIHQIIKRVVEHSSSNVLYPTFTCTNYTEWSLVM